MAPPLRYAYPAAIGAELKHWAENQKRAKRLMNNAYDYGKRRDWLYRCSYDGQFVTIRRVA